MKITKYPTQKEIKQVLDYDKETGIFTWKKRSIDDFRKAKYQKRCLDMWNLRHAGAQAGKDNGTGYLVFKLFGKTVLASRIAYIYVYGENIDGYEIDHINRNKQDNRISNIRKCNRKVNVRNSGKRKTNTSGVVGVYYNNHKCKWVATIFINLKKKELCSSHDFNRVVLARYNAELKYGYIKDSGQSTAYEYLKTNELI